MPQLILALDSHGLSAFQRCRREFKEANINHLESIVPKDFYDKGTLVHAILALYRRLRRRGFESGKAALLCSRRIDKFSADLSLDKQTKAFLVQKFFEYISYYKTDPAKTVGVEVGFSEVLYEDKKYLFIYEGRIDWIVMNYITGLGQRLAFVDTKTRSQDYDLNPYCNQFFGYAWALRQIFGTKYDLWGFVDYFGLQKTKTDFERSWFKFTEAQIQDWVRTTVYWYHQIISAQQFNIFPQNWQCSRKFGDCDFVRLCCEPNEKIRNGLKKTYFRKRDSKWQAWKN